MDIFAEAEGDFEALFGLGEPVQHLDHEKITGILGFLNDFSVAAGGGAANVAKIAALLGVSACFAGTVGSRPGEGVREPDRFARLFEEELRAAGVELLLSRSSRPTGVFLMLRNSAGDTRIAVAPSAALDFSEGDISEDCLRRARVVVLDGYLLGRDGLVRRVLDLGARHGTVTALDLGSEEMARLRAAEIRGYCGEFPLILFMNEGEAAAFYEALGCPGAEEDDEEGDPPPLTGERRRGHPVFRRICSFFKSITRGDLFPIIVVKRGPRGAMVFAGGDIYRAGTRAIIPLETTGAGDAFCAAFLSGWIRGRSLGDCAVLGNRAAREVLDVPGTRIEKRRLAPIGRALRGP